MENPVITYLNKLVNVPSTDPDDARHRKLLNVLLLGIFALTILLVLTAGIRLLTSQMTVEEKNGAIFITITGIALLAGCAIVYFINRKSGTFASTVFLFFLLLAFAFSDPPKEVSNGRSLIFFAIPIMMASILIRPGASFIFATLSSMEIYVLARTVGLAPNLPGITSFFMLALVSWLSSRGLEQALHELRIINADLDKIVAERTHELAEALTREHTEAGRNQAILNSIADGVIVFNAANRSILANPALSELIETPIQNLTGINLTEFVKTQDLSSSSRYAIIELIQRPEKNEEVARIEWGKKSLSVGVARVQDTATKENIGAVAVFRDVTREAELEKMKENFVAIVSHELRTPLNAIMGLTEMLQEGIYGALNDKQASIAQRLMANVTRLLGMVGDLLDEAQIGAGRLSIKPQVFRTGSLLENLHSTMDKIAADKGLTLSSALDINMPDTIRGDPQRLQQILINLVNNAIKFTEKGSIRVHIIHVQPRDWKIEVIDTGIGIPENEIPYVFETFRQASNAGMTTRQHGGFGLGLSIVKQLVELMNGSVSVKSENGRGTTFTVVLPLESDH